MPLLGTAKYIKAWIHRSEDSSALSGFDNASFPLKECLAALETIGIRTDYDLLLQSDILEQTPSELHACIYELRMAVLDHLAAPGKNAAALLETNICANNRDFEAYQDEQLIKSGTDELDLLLDGGIRTGQIVEVCGSEGSGRTRLAIEYAAAHLVSGLDPQQHAVKTKVYYLQSSPLPMWKMSQVIRRSLDVFPEASRDEHLRSALERLIVVDCSDIDALLTFLYKYSDARGSVSSGHNQRALLSTDLVIIDSIRPLIIDVIRLEKESTVAVHSVKLVLRKITRMQRHAKTAVLITNGIAQRSDWQNQTKYSSYSFDQLRLTRIHPGLGYPWSLVSHVHLYLEKQGLDRQENQQLKDVVPGNALDSHHHPQRTIAAILKSPSSSILKSTSFCFPSHI
ncbi:DNA repair protein rad51d [Coemansia erecta]|uniref:DNA repair protein rad51d n=1 Tax=Coemansia asiatica TaxID=1052880 RepID=A0A9W7XRX4_9FUNG|nr:DNA repair protein rad51d [Coemansia asiatica]KAJ2858564.1 DNA repair protein rad51d [Coemansia erecta]KAJ2889254.1 DNA repair protein rad51d [Coemansia asiatica]